MGKARGVTRPTRTFQELMTPPGLAVGTENPELEGSHQDHPGLTQAEPLGTQIIRVAAQRQTKHQHNLSLSLFPKALWYLG